MIVIRSYSTKQGTYHCAGDFIDAAAQEIKSHQESTLREVLVST